MANEKTSKSDIQGVKEHGFTIPPKPTLWPAVGASAHLAAVFVLGVMVLFTYVGTLYQEHGKGFALDNKFIILEDPRLRDATKENVKLVFTQDYWWPKAVSGLYRPLTTLSYMFNYSVLGNRDIAWGYQLINLVLHWLNAVLLYFMVMILMQKAWPSFLVAAVFTTHPIATESVANLVGRADLFAMAAVLAGFLCYAKSTKVEGWSKVLWLFALALITTIGEFCKESTVVILPLIVLYDFVFQMQPLHKNWFVNLFKNFWGFCFKGYIALLPAFAILGVVRSFVFDKLRPPEFPFVDNPLVDLATYAGGGYWNTTVAGTLTAIKVIGKYFYLLLWPQVLCCDYSYNQVPIVNLHFSTWEDWKSIIALISVIMVLVIGFWSLRNNKPLAFFILFFFITLLPTSNLIKVIGSIMAERFLYMPSIGYAGCLVVVVYSLSRMLIPFLDISEWAQRVWLQVVARSVLLLIVAACIGRSFMRNRDWENDVTLWTQGAQACPNSFKTHKSLAFALYEKDIDAQNIDRIIQEGEAALKVTRRTQIVFLHLGAYYRIKGDSLARRSLDGSLALGQDSVPWYQKSVDILTQAIPLDRAFNDDNRAKELQRGRKEEQIPDIGNHEIYWNLGLSHMRLGQYKEAIEAFTYMRHLSPANPDACLSMASAYIGKGETENAIVALLETLLLDSNRQEALRGLVELYRQFDKQGCAIVYPGGQIQPRLNADCALVKTHICTAYVDMVKTFIAAKQFELAQRTKEAAITHYSCSPDRFGQLPPTTAAPRTTP